MINFEEKKALLQEYKNEIQVKFELLQKAKEDEDMETYWIRFKNLMELCSKSMQICNEILLEVKNNVIERKEKNLILKDELKDKESNIWDKVVYIPKSNLMN
jgi:hypothetical protein